MTRLVVRGLCRGGRMLRWGGLLLGALPACARVEPTELPTHEVVARVPAPEMALREHRAHAARTVLAPVELSARTFLPSLVDDGSTVWLADTDPSNDMEVAPPQAMPQCPDSLAESGIDYQRAALPFTRKRGDDFLCGAPQVVIYEGSPEGVAYSSRPVVTCRMALALARFETLAQELAVLHLGSPVRKVMHLGTYSCRRARGGTMVSEHSYANAIDVRGFQLDDGRFVSVGRHFWTTVSQVRTAESRFLRALAARLYEDGIFSSVLTPHFDEKHQDHFHFDLARYRVDGAHD